MLNLLIVFGYMDIKELIVRVVWIHVYTYFFIISYLPLMSFLNYLF